MSCAGHGPCCCATSRGSRVPGARHGIARSLVCAPFFHGGVPAGTVEVFISTPGRGFDEHDRNTVSLLAAMLSTALSQAAEFTAKRSQVETLARFEASFQGAPNGIAMVTADGAIAACNPAFHAFVGFTDEELVGLTLGGDLLPGADAEHDELFAALLAGERDRYRVEREFRRGDGSLVWGDASFALVRDAGGEPTFAIAMVQDVSARKRAEAERERMEIELRHAQKLESVGQLAAGIAHEINTPIQFVGDSVALPRARRSTTCWRSDATQQRLRRRAPSRRSRRPRCSQRVARRRGDADLDYLRERVPRRSSAALDGVERVATIVRAMKDVRAPAERRAGAGRPQPGDPRTR